MVDERGPGLTDGGGTAEEPAVTSGGDTPQELADEAGPSTFEQNPEWWPLGPSDLIYEPLYGWHSSVERQDALPSVLRWAVPAALLLLLAPITLIVGSQLTSGGLKPFGSRLLVTILFAAAAAITGSFAYAKVAKARAAFERRRREETERASGVARQALREGLALPKLMELNRGEIANYQKITRDQATDSYRKMQVATIAGFLFVVAGGTVAFIQDDSTHALITGGLSGIATVLATYIARTFSRAYENSLTQLNYYYDQPLVSSYLLSAERIARAMSKTERDRYYGVILESCLDVAARAQSAGSRVPENRERRPGVLKPRLRHAPGAPSSNGGSRAEGTDATAVEPQEGVGASSR